MTAESLRRIGGAIAHRGPDDGGTYQQSGIGLVHRRLSIIDLHGGRQPLANEDGSVQVVFNGEIYNFVELRNDLESRGHRFRTRADTEVLVHLYEEMGERLVERLRGMFAFAIWDARRQRLLLARDRIGIKPLYVYRDAEKLLFGSELKAILAADDVDRTIDPAAVEDYVAYGFIPGEQSIFARIRKLPPAHTLCVSPADWRAVPRRYWELSPRTLTTATSADWQAAVQDKVDETVRVHRLADVEVGGLLSGGIDSTIITSVLVRQAAQPVPTFSIGFDDPRFDESSVARRTATRLGCTHFDEIERVDAAPDLDEFVRIYDEPFADSSAIPMLRLSRLAARHVKVVLSGDGGDEAFGGYRRYVVDLREAAWRRRIPAAVRRRFLGPLGAVWPKADWAPRPLRAKTWLSNLALESGASYANTLALCRNPWRRRLCGPLADLLRSHRPEKRFADAFSGDDFLGGMIGVDMRYHLPDDYLTKVDRASMAFGLEVRPPFVDHELLELAWQIPSDFKIRNSETKWILKQAFADVLPTEVAHRPKQGFEVPIDAWLKGPLREPFETLVLAPQARIGELIDQTTASQLFQHHLRGFGRHGPTLWSLIVLGAWCERYLTTRPEATSPSGVRMPKIIGFPDGVNA